MTELDLQNDYVEHEKPSLTEVLETLRQENDEGASIIGATITYGLSDISGENLRLLRAMWSELMPSYKHRVIQALVHASENSFEYNFKQIGLLGLTDESAMVRSAAIDLLWEDESVETLNILLNVIRDDESSNVKAQALVGISRYVLLGEYEDIPKSLAMEIQELVLHLHKDESQPVEVRRRALEALANSSHKEKDSLIRHAYQSDNHLMKVSSLFAMGRSCDDKWQNILLDELDNDDQEMVYEAVRACGEIQIDASVSQIKELLLSDDQEIQTMSIWALGEIGGKESLETLSMLQETVEDEDLLEIIDEAIDVASFSIMGASFDFNVED